MLFSQIKQEAIIKQMTPRHKVVGAKDASDSNNTARVRMKCFTSVSIKDFSHKSI